MRTVKTTIKLLLLSTIFLTISCSDSYHFTRDSGLESLSLLRTAIQVNEIKNSAIIGQVRDRETDEPIWGSNVTIDGTNLGSATDSLGNYVIKNIPDGTYTIRASLVGYHVGVADSIVINGNELVVLDFRLAVGAFQMLE